MHVEDVVARLELRFEVLDVGLFAHGAGGGYGAATKHIVESVGIEGLKIDVRVDDLVTHGVWHADHLDAIFGTLLWSNVAIRIAKKC